MALGNLEHQKKKGAEALCQALLMGEAPAKLTQDPMDTRAEAWKLLKALPLCPESLPMISDQKGSGFLKHSLHTS